LSFASKWMELENIILSDVSQTQKAKNTELWFLSWFEIYILIVKKKSP
jgi:hypothetical protein